MSSLLVLIPAALGLGLLGLAMFLWTLKSGQYDDMEGAAHRILFEDDDDAATDVRPQAPARSAGEGGAVRRGGGGP